MKRWPLILLLTCNLGIGDVASSQSQSQFALLREPVIKYPTIYKLTKSFSEYYWGKNIMSNCYSGATSYIMTPTFDLLSATFYHYDYGCNRLLYGESQANWIRAFGSRGSGNNQFLWAEGLDAHGLCGNQGYSDFYFIFVLDTRNRRIAKLRYNWQTEAMDWLGTMGDGIFDHAPVLISIMEGPFCPFPMIMSGWLTVVSSEDSPRMV